jgi:hypothetical protein
MNIDRSFWCLLAVTSACVAGCGDDVTSSSAAGGGALLGGTTSSTQGPKGGTTTGGTASGGTKAAGGVGSASSAAGNAAGGATGGTTTALAGAGASLGGGVARAGASTGGTKPATGGTTTALAGTGGSTGGTTNAAAGNSAGGTKPTTGGTTTAPAGTGGSTGGTSNAVAGNSAGGTKPATGGTASGLAGAGANAGGGSSLGGTSNAAGGVAGGATGGMGGPGCPTSSDYVGNATWKRQLQVTSGAEYCGGSNEARTIEQELAAKGKLRIAPGTYPLPDAVGTYPFALPVCFEFPPGTAAPSFSGPGTNKFALSTFAPDVYYSDRISQPLAATTAAELIFDGRISSTSAVGATPPPIVFDGSPSTNDGSNQFSLGMCHGTSCSGAWNDINFLGCNPTTYRLSETTVTFDAGAVTLGLRIGMSMAGTEPALFVSATGTFGGTAFTQTDYWKLVYLPAHHHFTRNFALLFDAPINGACGLKILGVDPYNGAQLPKATTVNCDLSNILTLAVGSSVTPTP